MPLWVTIFMRPLWIGYTSSRLKFYVSETTVLRLRRTDNTTLTSIASPLLACLLLLGLATGQSTFGSIVGVVRDKTDALVPGATVKLRNLEDNSIRYRS